MLASHASVESALRHFVDPVQPRSGSVTAVPRGHTSGERFPFHHSFLDRMDEREELRDRFRWLERDEQEVLLRWYIEGASADAIARHLRCSVRRVYRLRAQAMDRLVGMGVDQEFADVDVDEFTRG